MLVIQGQRSDLQVHSALLNNTLGRHLHVQWRAGFLEDQPDQLVRRALGGRRR